MSSIEDENVIQAFFPGCAYPAFRKRIQVRTFPRKSNRLHSGVSQNRPKRFGETWGSVMDQIPAAGEESVDAVGQVAGSLFHPIVVRFGDDPRNSHLSGRQPDDE